ncbi:MAG: lectin like domain-containing protein [Synergistaceae bacterium]
MLSFSSLFKKANTLIIASILLSAGGFASYASASELVAAPLNPNFVEWQKKMDTARTSTQEKGSTGDSTAESPHGYAPSPVNWSHLDNEVISVYGDADHILRRGSDIPASYDLRPEMPAVRDQDPFGTCWTFSAMAAAESNLIHDKAILTSDNADLSEWYLAYYGYNDESNELPAFTYPSSLEYYNVGGDDWRSAAILTRGTGFLEESSAVYPTSAAAAYTPDVQARKYKLNNVLYLGNLGEREVRLKDARINTVKEAIMEYGAVSIGIYQGSDELYLNPTTKAYYIGTTENSPNHAVTIVGWDDTYPTSNFNDSPKPTKNGAWIVRNSWGSSWGASGHYYVSYQEGSLNDGVVYETVDAPDKEKIYQYDPLGLCRFVTYESADPVWFANIFTASRNEKINSVSFYTSHANSTCTVKIYKDCGSDPTGGALAAEKSVTVAAPGYNTVELDEEIDVVKNRKFSVVVSVALPEPTSSSRNNAGGSASRTTVLSSPAIPVEYPITDYSEKADASAGQSFISSDGIEWKDLTEESGYGNANVCIKAFGTSEDDPAGSSSGGCSTGPVMLILLGLGVLPLIYKGRKQ